MRYLEHNITPKTFELWLASLDPTQQADNDLKSAKHHVRCKSCLNYLTKNEYLIPVNGETNHFFTNPTGAGFDLLTYQLVEGCIISGKPTEFFTWFEGFSWQYCYCNSCNTHIGWYFSCENHCGFFALVTDRLLLD
jgi:hypothetical protein